jgi:hypothetical protein
MLCFYICKSFKTSRSVAPVVALGVFVVAVVIDQKYWLVVDRILLFYFFSKSA